MFDKKLTNTLTVVLLVLFVVSLTASAVSAAEWNKIGGPADQIYAGDAGVFATNLYQDTGSHNYQDQTSSDPRQGTQGVDNTYTPIDMDFDYEYGATGLMYCTDLMKGDTVEVEATSNLPVNFISGDDQFYVSYLMGSGNVNSFMNNGMDKGSVYQEESYSGATFYSLNKKMDRKSFNLIIQNPKRDSSLEGHIKIVVHSQFTKAQSGYVPSTPIHTNGNDLAEKMKKSAQEAKDKSDEWKADSLKDAVTYG